MPDSSYGKVVVCFGRKQPFPLPKEDKRNTEKWMSQAFNRQLREGLHTSFDLMIQWKLVCWSQKQKQKNQPITRPITENCNWFIVPLLLPTSDNQQPKYTGIIFKKNLAQLIWLPYRKENKGPELIFFYGYRGWRYGQINDALQKHVMDGSPPNPCIFWQRYPRVAEIKIHVKICNAYNFYLFGCSFP